MNNPNPVKIVETVLRDGHQSLCATRMRTSDMLPMLEALDDCGFYALEAWGGATFDSCLRFLNEDPWGTAAYNPETCEENQAADAAPWPEHPGLQPLCR